MFRYQNIKEIGAVAAFAVVAMAVPFAIGIPSGNDFTQHFQFADTIQRTIVSGNFYPSFGAYSNNGFGDLGLRFYPPLGYYPLSIASLAVGWHAASLLTFTFIFFAGGLGAYFWIREEFGSQQGLIAAAVYTFAPYHLNQIYNNFLFSEFTASAVLPFCFLFTLRVCNKQSVVNIIGLGISAALLILSNLPIAVAGSLSLLIYAGLLLRKTEWKKQLIGLVAGVFSALLFNAFYWVRFIFEYRWLKHASPKHLPAYHTGTYDFRANFLLNPANFINFESDVLVLWFADLMLIALLALMLPTLIFILKRKASAPRSILAAAVIFFFAMFMAVPLSQFIWESSRILQGVQFPWRWMAIMSLTGAGVASFGIYKANLSMKEKSTPFHQIGLALPLLFFVFMGAFVIKQAVYVPRADFNKMFEGLDENTSFEGWWPIWVKEEAFSAKKEVIIGDRIVNITEWMPTKKTFSVAAGNPKLARIHAFWYPHWQAKVDGSPVSVLRDDDGAILLALGPETSEVNLVFEEPLLNRAASCVSISAWIAAVLIFAFLFWKK